MVAVVVVALQMRATSDADEAEERLVQRSSWDVVEMLVIGVAFGLIGLDLRLAVEAAETGLVEMLLHAAVVVAVVFAVRALWMVGAWSMLRRSPDCRRLSGRSGRRWSSRGAGCAGSRPSRSPCHCRRRRRAAQPSRRGRRWWSSPARCWWRRCSCRGSRCGRWSGRWGVAEDAGAEHAAEEVVARRARKAALERMAAEEHAADLPDEVSAALH
ncbi:MAG TPA: Na+/H+ antiporter, partial [Pseudonocardia sp.]|nr:Na+/H+ antiporter [Pseudonocardia sp.]